VEFFDSVDEHKRRRLAFLMQSPASHFSRNNYLAEGAAYKSEKQSQRHAEARAKALLLAVLRR
jgi:hypothetical protein